MSDQLPEIVEDADELKTQLAFYESILTPGNRVRVTGPGYPEGGLVGTFKGEMGGTDKRLIFAFDDDHGLIRVADFDGYQFADAEPRTLHMQFLNAVANDPRIIGDVGATLPLKVGDAVRVLPTAENSTLRDWRGVIAQAPSHGNLRYGVQFRVFGGELETHWLARRDIEPLTDRDGPDSVEEPITLNMGDRVRVRYDALRTSSAKTLLGKIGVVRGLPHPDDPTQEYGVSFDEPGYHEPQGFSRRELTKIGNPVTPEQLAEEALGDAAPPKPYVGMPVRFVLLKDELRSAVVTKIPDPTQPWKVNLAVFMDVSDKSYDTILQAKGVTCDPKGELTRSWHPIDDLR